VHKTGINGEIILIGTAHVSDKSIAEVNETIEEIRPDIVAVELCMHRYEALKGKPSDISIKDILRGGIRFSLAGWSLSLIQKRIGASVGVEPGAEMMAAIEKAEEMGAEIALVDRDINVTLRRLLKEMGVLEKLRLFWAIFRTIVGRGEKIELESITDEDVVAGLLDELRAFSPTTVRILVDERDEYIASNLLRLAREKKVVAVVGAGHIEGIKRRIEG
jgi:pheromone shutdown-related protein TraB